MRNVLALLLLSATPSLAGQASISYVRVTGLDVTGCALLTLQVDAAPENAVMAYSVYDVCAGVYYIDPRSEPIASTALAVDRKGAARFQGLTFTRTAAKCRTIRTQAGAYLTECPTLVSGPIFGLDLNRVPSTTGSYR
jgi:hypothetical protein